MGNCICVFLKKDKNSEEIDIFYEDIDYSNKKTQKTYHPMQSSKTIGASTNIHNYNNNNTDTFVNSEEENMTFRNNLNPIFIAEEDDDIKRIEKRQKKIGKEDFQISKLLGRGGFGKVLLVEKKDNMKLYAMKIINKNMIERRNQKIHTKAERTILENIYSPFIVQLHFAFQTHDKLYLVMDFMIGGELFFHLRKCERFSEAKTRFYAAEIVLALEHLHKKNIIYRDLKPENILLDGDGHIKIADFGLSKQGIAYNEKTYTFCGTPDYLAPEILLGLGHDKSVDWWSLGILMYEMLAGQPPFYSKDKNMMFKNILENPIPMKPYFSPQASSILQSLLCLDCDMRLGSSPDDAQEIKNHSFFKNINWDNLMKKKVEPPFKPKIKDKKDLSNFAKMFTDEIAKDTPIIGRTNSHSQKYSNFTYVKKDNSCSSAESFLKGDESGELIVNPNFNFMNTT